MTRRKTVKPVRNKFDRLKYYSLTLLQAILGALVVVCIFVYRMTSSLYTGNLINPESYVPNFYELRGDYYESDGYTENINTAVNEIIRYMVIREQLETDGVYDPNKIIYVGAYAHRNDNEEYTGPDAAYYLDDLLKWGQRGVDYSSRVFFSWEEYNSFFNVSAFDDEEGLFWISEGDEDVTTDDDTDNPDEKKVVAYLDTIENRFKTVDGLNIEQVVDNSEDYNQLVSVLETTIKDLLSNYEEYNIYKEYFDNGNSNIKYCALIPSNNSRIIFTNVPEIKSMSSESFINTTLKGFGEYVYIMPLGLDFLSNTRITYQDLNTTINNLYSYAFTKDTKIWISLDTSYAVEDLFYKNYFSYNRVSRSIPWLVSSGLLAAIGFAALFIYLTIIQKKKYSVKNGVELLSDFDKLPIEISALFFIILVFILVLGESVILRSINIYVRESLSFNFIPISVLMGIDLFVILIFIYGFIRRLICHNLFQDSLFSNVFKYFDKFNERFRDLSQKIYDDSGLIIKVWLGYILFLVANLFLMLVILLGRRFWVPAITLTLLDIFVGIAIYKRNIERRNIIEGIKKINAGEYNYQLDSSKLHGLNRGLGEEINNIGQGISKAVETSIKDEKLKADLITNVSHDIKTPLTSILNYVDLIKKEKIDNENAVKYIKVIDDKAQRLRQLTFDLVEASKISSGNIVLDIVTIDFVELLNQTLGEFEDKFEEHKLVVVTNTPNTPVLIDADPRRMWRVIENLFNNIFKYAMDNTRVYIDLVENKNQDGIDYMHCSIKNVSKNELNIPADELTERFIRGDVSRSTEGSGLGLSIAKSLTIAQNGNFDIYLDGDLFKVTLSFPIKKEEAVS